MTSRAPSTGPRSAGDRLVVSRRGLLGMGAGLVAAPAVGWALTGPAAAAAGDTLETVGLNDNGQLGTGSFTNSTTLRPVSGGGLLGVDEVHGGREHVIARRGGDVFTWGDGSKGALGNGSLTDVTTPQQVTRISGATSVTTAHYGCYAVLGDGTVRSWGYNATGQLGDGTTTRRATPVTVRTSTGTLGGVRRVAAGRDMGVAIVGAGGGVYTWGRGASGELGNGSFPALRATAGQVPGLSGVVALACGRNHVLALLDNGTVRAWGRNDYGQLGDGTLTNRSTPVAVSGLGTIVAVAAGADHSVAVRDDGRVYTWGRNNRGQLGIGSTSPSRRATPALVTSSVSGVVGAGCGRDHVVVWTGTGAAWWWGWNLNGQLGGPAGGNRTSPVAVPGGGVKGGFGGHGYTVIHRD